MANNGEGGGYSLFFNSQSMKKFSEIKDGLSSLAKISKEQIAEARLAFSELPQEEQDTAKADLDTLEAKVEEETPTPAEETPKDPSTEVTDPVPPVDAPPAPPAPAEEGGKQFSETSFAKLFSEFGIKTPEELALKFAELQKFHKQETLGKQVDTLIFSESNKTGIVLAKAKDKIMSFAEKLPTQMHSEFLGLFSKDIIAPSGKIFSEIGKGNADIGGGSEDPVEAVARKAFAETPEGTDPHANAALAVAKVFAEKSGKAFTECTQDATKFVEGLSL